MTEQKGPTITMTSNRPYLLRAMYDWISDNNLTPYVLVDAGMEGVQVPPQAVHEGRVVLNVDMQAVANLDLGDEWVSFKARFSGVSHLVRFPVAAVQAVYAQENGQGMMFADEGAPPPPPPPPADGPKPAPDSAKQGPAAETSGKRGPPHLRVIK